MIISEVKMVGIFLVLIGIVWLLNQMGIISASVANFIWPVILIAVGLSLVFRRRHWRSWCCGPWDDKEKK